MKIAFFHDLPDGGALTATYEILKRLSKTHTIDCYQFKRNQSKLLNFQDICNNIYEFNFQVSDNRLTNDIAALTKSKIVQKKIARIINNHNYDVTLVTHTRFFQAPWILRYLDRSVFLCQEPTRAFFEEFLKVDSELPPLNKLYEHSIRWIKKRIEIKNAQYAESIIANSSFSARQIQKAYNHKAVPISLGVDTQKFYPMNINRKNQMIIVGNNEPQKSLNLAIQAVGEINKKYRPDLVIVSPRSADMSNLKMLAKDSQLNLKLHSRIDTKELRRLYNQSLLTLATAIKEPFGLSVVESMACGTPVVAVKEGGFRETIIDGKTGILVPRNKKKIAKAITSLIKNKKTWLIMSKQTRKHMKDNFSWNITVKKIEKILRT